MKNISCILTYTYCKVVKVLLIFLLLFGLIGCDIFKDKTTVMTKANPTILNGVGTSNITANITGGPPNNTPIVKHRVKFDLSTTKAGTLNSPTAVTNGSGDARVIFTSVNVNEDTKVVVTATAKSGNGASGNATITVKPPIIFGDFGGDPPGISITNADLLIEPSVIKLGSGYQFTYTITTHKNSNFKIDHLYIVFAVPMVSVTADSGTVNSQNEKRVNTITTITAVKGITIVAICKDCDTGGIADFDIFSGPVLPPGVLGTPSKSVSKKVIGPKP